MAAKRTAKAKGKAAAKKSSGPARKKAAPSKKGAKPSAKKLTPKKAAPKKAPPRKAPPKKAAPKKAPPKKAQKPAPKTAPTQKALGKPSAAKKPVATAADTKAAKVVGAAPSSDATRKLQVRSGGPTKASSRGILPPPRSGDPKSSKKGEVLTLLPARSSQPGADGRAPATRSDVARPRAASSPPARGRGVTLVRRTSDRPVAGIQSTSLPIPVRKVEAAPTVEERFARIEKRLEALDEASRAEFYGMFDQAWVSHDSHLEGNVYTREEIQAGFSAEPILTDSSLQPAADEIRRHREAIEYVRDFGLRKRLPVTVDVIKKIFLILHPSEGDLKTVKYRRDVPQHRLYFHEYTAPDKIAYKVRQIVDWLNEPETRKTRNALRIAARAHYDLVRVFPFQSDSGKVARLFMNLLLYRSGYPPAIIHAKERQAYYEALKGEPNRILRIVQDSVEDGLSSIEKFLDEQESRKRPFVS